MTLADYAPNENILILDVKDFLVSRNYLKRKRFSESCLKEFDFSSIYQGKIVALYCSSDAIVPMWAFMLVTSYLNPICSNLYFGKKEEVLQKIILCKYQ